uniref:ARAD1C15378p n=1 Tax=Blastobotrys adeninivorans TaxID=409370 RepID=A0A060T1B6_BLAAD
MSEQDVLNHLLEVRTELQALKKDRSKYLKSSDLEKLREELGNDIDVIVNLPERSPKLEAVMEDVFQLVSLALLTVGHTRSPASTYASLSTLHRILEHLAESSTITEEDVAPIHSRLEEIRRIVEAEQPEDTGARPSTVKLFKQKLEKCQNLLNSVEASMAKVSDGLKPILRKVVLLRREIMSAGSKVGFSARSLKPLQEQLAKFEAMRNSDGLFVDDKGVPFPDGQAQVNGVMEKCHTLLAEFTAQHDFVDPSLKPIFTRLVEMKTQLENLLVTHRWTLRETDLYGYQRQLQEIDDLRVNGVFVSAEKLRGPSSEPPSGVNTPTGPPSGGTGTPMSTASSSIPRGQTILLYLLRRCYAIIYKLLESSEPVSEALTPIHNQLNTVRRCLLEVKRMGGVSEVRELYPYQMKLASIDALRVDGKFMVGGSIPEGQGMLNALLAECFDICHELKVELNDRDEDDD